ncbi:MAG: hypothetical protein ABI255_08720 [Microbacteriaceae bacterium]
MPSPVSVPDRTGRAVRDRYWLIPLTRAAAAFVVAGVTTFTALHSPQFGLLVFSGYAIASGLVLAALSAALMSDRIAARLFTVQGLLGVIAGVVALVASGSGLPFFQYLVTIWAAATGLIELYCGLRSGRQQAVPGPMRQRDWRGVGAFTAALALVFVFLPGDAVLAVGVFGVYAVMLGVYLAIAAFSLKWGAQSVPSAPSLDVRGQAANSQEAKSQ